MPEMKPSAKLRLPLSIVIIPYVFLLVYYLDHFYFTEKLYFFLPLGLMILLPFSALALLLKFLWKIDYEDGTGKGDALTLFFGTLSFMGIICGIAAWFYLVMMAGE